MRACGSSWLLRVRKILHDQCERYRQTSVNIMRQTRDLQSEHRAIADAVINRDAELAARLVEQHFEVTTRILVDELNATALPPA